MNHKSLLGATLAAALSLGAADLAVAQTSPGTGANAPAAQTTNRDVPPADRNEGGGNWGWIGLLGLFGLLGLRGRSARDTVERRTGTTTAGSMR
jgi:hypothetical protein